jgi:UDP-3-O-[3-hydroxymyristoyl] N-acetylglucosamine deacetylase
LRRTRRTLAASTETLEGIGLHSGAPTRIRLLPAEQGTGIVFRDQATGQEIPARVENVWDTTRCTQLRKGETVVQTVEHVLSALAGLGVDDALIEISGVELPATDGSSAPFVRLIQSVGVAESACFVESVVVSEPVEVTDGHGGFLRLKPASELCISVTLEYPNHPYLGTQHATFAAAFDDYPTDIAPARTFGFLTEIEQLHARGLGLGASYDNALVLGDDRYLNACRFDNELARHKLLDFIGDLALVGKPLVADVVAVRPGHRLNTKLAELLSGQT